MTHTERDIESQSETETSRFCHRSKKTSFKITKAGVELIGLIIWKVNSRNTLYVFRKTNKRNAE